MNKSAKIDYLDHLKKTIREFLEDLKCVFESESDILDIETIQFFFERQHPEQIYNHANKYLIPFAPKIRDRDLTYFSGNLYIFSALDDPAKIAYYKNAILDKNIVGESDQKIIWEYLGMIVNLIDCHHKTR